MKAKVKKLISTGKELSLHDILDDNPELVDVWKRERAIKKQYTIQRLMGS